MVRYLMGTIANDEHVFIAGMTGSGKTFLIQNYLPGVTKKVMILDTKGTFEWPQVPDKTKVIIRKLIELEQVINRYDRIIYRPDREELIPEYYNAFFEYCYYLHDCTVVVDEVMQVCPSPAKIPEF
jgi:type IV secretory pathway ATPase VirB11/archaellum biosynthesis ATPase